MRKIGLLCLRPWLRRASNTSIATNKLGLVRAGALVCLLVLITGLTARAENPPALLWKTNVGGARLFSVDAQANAYASTNGAVITLNGDGSVIQSNNICPLPGIAQRDAGGNYYFSGSFDGTNDFGGVVLVGGCGCNTSHPELWTPGWPSCFLAKYSGNGNLQWVTKFGLPGAINRTDDLIVNPNGTLTVGYDGTGLSRLAMFSVSGSNLWNNSLPGAVFANCFSLTVSPFAGTNGLWLDRRMQTAVLGSYDAGGNFVGYSPGPLFWANSLTFAARPVPGTNNDGYASGFTPMPNSPPVLRKAQAGPVVEWEENLGSVEQWVLAGDNAGNLFLSGTDGSFSKYDGDGNLMWSTNYGSPVSRVVANTAGDSFLAFADGSIGRLEGPPAPPMLSLQMCPAGVEIHWSSKLTGYSLQSAAIGSTNWEYVTDTPATNSNDVVVTNAVSPKGKLYRLRR